MFCAFFYLFYSGGNKRNILVGYPNDCRCLSPDLLLAVLFPLAVPSILLIELVVDFEREVDMLSTLYGF